MRRLLIALSLVALAAAPAAAGTDVDIAAFKSELVVLGDGAGHYLVLVPYTPDDEPIFYGDGKVMHQLTPMSGGGSPGEGNYSHRVWAPNSPQHADIAVRGGKDWTVTCTDRTTEFSPVDERTATEILSSAKFRAPLWKRSAYLLARDDRGIYYYADILRGERYGLRLFSGKRGAMRELRLTDVVSDSEGDILFSRRGKLRVDGSRFSPNRQATWIRGKKKQPLKLLPVSDNRLLIYRHLGVYTGETFGTPCDDL